MKFRTTIELGGKTATGLPVPADVVDSLGQGKRPRVRVTIGDHTYRSTVASMDGRYMIPLSAENRGYAGVSAGEDVDVGVELDTEPREVTVPPHFAKALDAHAGARRHFDALSYSRKQGFLLGIEGAKTAETRQRRIDKAVVTLQEPDRDRTAEG